MASSSQLLGKIEELRRQLHEGMGGKYDPIRVQSLVGISQELDRLVVEIARAELEERKGPHGS